MKTISLQPKKASINRVSGWLHSKNQFFSSLMEEQFSNLQVLLIVHVLFVASLILSVVFIHPAIAVVLFCWLGWAVQLCKKGGLK